jgi:exodeoxyribonuclease-3
LEELRDRQKPNILCLQETKVHDEMYPHAAVEEASGFGSATHGQKGHYGVATLTKVPPQTVQRGFSADTEDAQRRLIITHHALSDGRHLTVVNGYFPQGENVSHETKWPAKRKFYADLTHWLETESNPDDLLVILGDFNIAPVDEDIGIGDKNAQRWLREGKSAFQPEERAWFEKLRAWGLTDSYRHLYPGTDNRYSWFDYRSRGFEDDPKRGLRIDHILVSKPLVPLIKGAGIDYETRGTLKPSDHAPVWLDLDLTLANLAL